MVVEHLLAQCNSYSVQTCSLLATPLPLATLSLRVTCTNVHKQAEAQAQTLLAAAETL